MGHSICRVKRAIRVVLGLLLASTSVHPEARADDIPRRVDATNVRRPATEAELRFWLENMVWRHRFSHAEISSATGLSQEEITAALDKLKISEAARPKRQPGDRLLVLPYPGGRHPRSGFLDGAVNPQRETKFSVFAPWDDSSYVVADIPEALWSNLGLLYLAHTHVPTLWTKAGIELTPLEWKRLAEGVLEIERKLPNGIVFGVKIEPRPNHVRMELWLTNGTKATLSDLRVQNCVMLKGARGFESQTNDNKKFQGPYTACKSIDGKRWVITAWDHANRTWGNAPCPCLHSDPKFPDCAPGETKHLVGWLSFFEGTDIEGELSRIEDTGWRKAVQAETAPYDLIVRNARIVDGTGNPWVKGDVAVRGERIVAVGVVPPAPAKRAIDAQGHVLTPGFIDMHSHSDLLLLEDGNAQSKIRQGVTTEVLGEGESAGPASEPRSLLAGGKTIRWASLGEYLTALEQHGIAVNVASYVGLDTIWHNVMGRSFARPKASQFEKMKLLVDAALQDGAFGLSSQLAMPPGSLATTDDIVELCRVVALHHGIFSSHMRNEGTGIFDSVKEVIAISERAGIPADAIHLKIADQQYWNRMNEVVGLIEAARRKGINVQANVYPYTRGNNNLASIVSPWAHEGGTQKMLERLADPAQRERLKREIHEGLPGWYNHYTAVGGDWSRILINGRGVYEGLTMDRVIAAKSKGKNPPPDALDILFDLLIEQGGSIPAIYEHHTEKDMNLALIQPWCSIGSDGSAHATEGPLRRGYPHPRSFGTFPRVLGVYVRERGVLRLEDAIRKMTSLNAAKLGITDRGMLRAGNFADLVVFDPEHIIDRSTYEKPFQYAEGIDYVIVNGQVVLDHGTHTEAKPGKALRHSK
jgi:N-acyl-D-aspartate/D-glutamate deacylase